MRVLNPSRFIVKVGDRLEYNQDAIDWINGLKNTAYHELWLSADELNARNPTVQKYELFVGSSGEKLIELWVKHDDKYTGYSGVICDDYTDMWCVSLDGSVLDNCPYSLFKKKVVN